MITLLLYLFQQSTEKPFFFNLFGSTEPSSSITQDVTDTRIITTAKKYKNYNIQHIPRNRIKNTTTKTTTTTTTSTTTTTTNTTTSNIIFESNEEIDFSVCHPENNPACVLDQVYSCSTSKECDEKGKCERKTVCGIKYFSKVKE